MASANRGQIQRTEHHVAVVIDDREDNVAEAMLDHRFASRVLDVVVFGGILKLGVKRDHVRISEFQEVAVSAVAGVVPIKKIGEAG